MSEDVRGNLARFLRSTVPQCFTSKQRDSFPLAKLWDFYDRPYGFDIDFAVQQHAHHAPISSSSSSSVSTPVAQGSSGEPGNASSSAAASSSSSTAAVPSETQQQQQQQVKPKQPPPAIVAEENLDMVHYIPHLSAIQLFEGDTPGILETFSASRGPLVSPAFDPPSAVLHSLGNGSRHHMIQPAISPEILLAALSAGGDTGKGPVEPGPVIRARAASVESQDGESGVSASSGNAPNYGFTSVVTANSQGSSGGGSPRLLFQFYETATPDKRIPFIDRIKELARASDAGALLLRLESAEIDPRSWFAVHWLPVLCHSSTSALIKGAFITYHRIACLQELHTGPESVTLPMIGFVPYKVIDKAWYADTTDARAVPPLQRIFSVGTWLTKTVKVLHPDYEHSIAMGMRESNMDARSTASEL